MVTLSISFNTPRGIAFNSAGQIIPRKTSNLVMYLETNKIAEIVGLNSRIPSFMYSEIV